LHIPDGFLTLQICAITYLITIVFWYFAFKKAREKLDDRHVPLLAMLTAMFFAAQMMNYPIIGGTTAHLLGGPIVALTLGPYAGLISMTIILVLQALLFGDGGIITLGSNVLNIGVIGVFISYLVFISINKFVKDKKGIIIGAFLGAFFGDLFAAIAAGLELGLSVPVFLYGISISVSAMAVHHSIIGIIEGIVTSLIILTFAKARPDLLNIPKITPVFLANWSYSSKGV
jgi:cobalt/nickel transport system permease protein